MSEQSDMAAYAAAMEPEVPTEMGKLWEKHLAVTRQHLRVANCFSALRDFEKGFGKLKGVGNLVFEIGHSRGQLEAGLIRLQLRKDDVFHVAGNWSVTEEGDATVEFAQVTTVSCPGPQLGTELRRLIGSKQLKLILDRVSMEANLASFLPEFGEE
ncbi:hypothetical protein [Rhizobium sp. BK176]|uniref:hypothetical protein n=1 Tax=Rhizobium sp. BK176 TaxID=2587071 RepID=UPI002168A947|nr:hypothetical protein [Rhizobium sp. BK176]MCS4088581.1 hypothetical protein [Rhizobium sp. BK176]